MHDCKGRPISLGDTVMVPFTVTHVSATDEYRNVTLETVAVMFPSDRKTMLTANTRQVIRANEGDDTSYEAVTDESGKVLIR
jgi:hypothetical protein